MRPILLSLSMALLLSTPAFANHHDKHEADHPQNEMQAVKPCPMHMGQGDKTKQHPADCKCCCCKHKDEAHGEKHHDK